MRKGREKLKQNHNDAKFEFLKTVFQCEQIENIFIVNLLSNKIEIINTKT